MADAEAQEVVAGKLRACQMATLRFVEAPGPGQEFVGDALMRRAAVDLFVSEEMPDDDEDVMGDDGDGVIGVLAALEFVEAALPERVGADGAPGDFDERPAEFLAAFFGDGFGAVFGAALVDTWGEPGVGNEMFGRRETGDIADGGQDGHGSDDAEARHLHEIHGLGSPGFLMAKLGQFVREPVDLVLEILFGFQVEVDLEALHGRKVLTPGQVFFLEAFAFGMTEMVTMRDAVHAVDDFGVHADELPPLGDEMPKFTDVDGGHPDFWDEIGGQEMGEDEGVAFVGFGAGLGNLLDADGIGDLDFGDEGSQQIVDVPGVGGGFDDDAVGRDEMVSSPARELVVRDFTRRQDDVAVAAETGGEGVVLVDVESDEARACIGNRIHATLSISELGRGFLGEERYTPIRAQSPRRKFTGRPSNPTGWRKGNPLP